MSAIEGSIGSLDVASVVGPLGLHHDDHVTVSDACFQLARLRTETCWFAYDEVPYTQKWPYERDDRLRDIRRRWPHLERLAVWRPSDKATKHQAVGHYRSQLHNLTHADGFGDVWDEALAAPEGYWRIGP